MKLVLYHKEINFLQDFCIYKTKYFIAFIILVETTNLKQAQLIVNGNFCELCTHSCYYIILLLLVIETNLDKNSSL